MTLNLHFFTLSQRKFTGLASGCQSLIIYLRPELAAGVGICSLSHKCALAERWGFSLLFSSHLDSEVAREIEKIMLLDCVRAWFEKPDTAVPPVLATAIDENVFNKTSKISTFAIATQSLFLKNETYNQS